MKAEGSRQTAEVGSPAELAGAVERAGFALITGILGPSEIQTLLAELAAADITAAGGERNLFRRCPAVAQLARSESVLRLVRPILGPAAFPVRTILFDKTPDANWKVAWHQDLAIAVAARRDVDGFGPWSIKAGVPHAHAPVALLERMVSARIHLDDCGAENGPLRVLPGTHRLGKLSAVDIARLSAERESVSCLAPAGSVLLLRPLLLHASSAASQPSAHRRVLHLKFAAEELPGGLKWFEQPAQPTAFIALGANLGDPAQTVRAAMDCLQAFSDGPLHRSSLVESAPVDCPPGSPMFVNAVVGLQPRAGETPESLLAKLQALEREFGRQPKKVLNEARPLDLDLIAFGGEMRASAALTLPHPRAHLRRFVLAPLAEIAPELVLSGQTRTVRELLAALPPEASAR